jgi:hypothetical protein
MGWSGKKNGELLKLMAQQAFEVFLTVDQNLRFQQNLSGAGVGIIVLVAAMNRLADLQPLIPRPKRHKFYPAGPTHRDRSLRPFQPLRHSIRGLAVEGVIEKVP